MVEGAQMKGFENSAPGFLPLLYLPMTHYLDCHGHKNTLWHGYVEMGEQIIYTRPIFAYYPPREYFINSTDQGSSSLDEKLGQIAAPGVKCGWVGTLWVFACLYYPNA